MSASSFERLTVFFVVALAAMGCDATTCIRNSDCVSPLVCSNATCAMPPTEAGVDLVDAALPLRDSSTARPDPDSGVRVDSGDVDVDAGPDGSLDELDGSIDGSIDAGSDPSADAATDAGADAMTDGG